jgi:hypothetical protein
VTLESNWSLREGFSDLSFRNRIIQITLEERESPYLENPTFSKCVFLCFSRWLIRHLPPESWNVFCLRESRDV